MNALRARFERIREFLEEDERELIAEAARRDPGEKIRESIGLMAASLPDYRRYLANPSLARDEDDRAWHKADLHDRWRERHP